jgi:UDP-N-acetylglucosamine 2-epimerase (non-hydrolysing)
LTNSNEHVSLSIVLLKLYELETSIDYRLIPTGQHYDKNMSGDFFEQLEIPPPLRNLKCGKGSQSEQTAHTMIVFKKELEDNPTDFVLVVGDVTSTTA